jgi:gamma-D-glutamyl-L-lysine dipeptidyl-peptidase
MSDRGSQRSPVSNDGTAGPDASGVVTVYASIAPLHGEPRVSSPQVSQRLAGHRLHVLAQDGDWLRVRGDDGYEGWVHRGYLRDPSDTRAAPTKRLLSLGCVVRDATTGTTRALPLGAWVAVGESVVGGEAVNAASHARTFKKDALSIAATALERFAGTPYQWGGVTPWGADCSGLVQTTFWLHRVLLPRDAWQQAEMGADAGTNIARLEPADLLFFSERPDRRITHVGMSLGGSKMVHLSLGRGGYAVEQLDNTGDPYVAALVERFVTARRIV